MENTLRSLAAVLTFRVILLIATSRLLRPRGMRALVCLWDVGLLGYVEVLSVLIGSKTLRPPDCH
jgi:hypothetical protein